MDILLVDDDVDCLDGLVTAFEPAGHRCDKFTVPEEAVEAYRKKIYDVVITDIKMPGINGVEVIKRIQLLNRKARVIVVTGYGDEEKVVAAARNRAYALFGKPIDINNLMDILFKIESDIDDERREKTCKDTCGLCKVEPGLGF